MGNPRRKASNWLLFITGRDARKISRRFMIGRGVESKFCDVDFFYARIERTTCSSVAVLIQIVDLIHRLTGDGSDTDSFLKVSICGKI